MDAESEKLLEEILSNLGDDDGRSIEQLVAELRAQGKPVPVGLLQLISNKPASELLASGEAVGKLWAQTWH